MYRFERLIARADDETLQAIVGRPVVRLLDLLDPRLSRPGELRSLILESRDPDDLLRDVASRQLLIPLLPPEVATELGDRLGIESTGADLYAKLATKRFRRRSSAEETFLGFFGVVASEPEQDGGTPTRVQSEARYKLFEHQRRAVRQVREALDGEPHRAVLHMPTGAGKTRTAVNLIIDHLRRHEPHVVVWLAYSEELCEQTAVEFDEAWGHLGDRPLPIFRYFGDHELDITDVQDGFVVAGLAKLFSRAKRDHDFIARLGDRTTLVIIDEAHQAIAETYQFVLESLVERDFETRLLGLTATPGRTWNDVEEDERLSAFFGRAKVGLEIDGYSNPVDYLIDEQYLARPTFVPLHYGGAELTREELAELSAALDVPARILEKLADDEQRNLLIVERTEQLARRHDRVLVFATTVAHARLIAAVLRSRGLRADAVTGDMPRGERSRVIAAYRSDAEGPHVLVNFGVLTTGFDAPRTSAALIARPTTSLVLYSQMVGRATRGPKAGGNKESEIVTVVDTALPGFADVADAFVNWEDVWDDTDDAGR